MWNSVIIHQNMGLTPAATVRTMQCPDITRQQHFSGIFNHIHVDSAITWLISQGCLGKRNKFNANSIVYNKPSPLHAQPL